MTELAIAPSAANTPLATLLVSAAKAPLLGNYRTVLTPRELDAPVAETEALRSGAAVHDLGWMRRITVRGDDRFRWLSGMVTNTVNDLPANGGAWNLVLNAQGRIQGDLTVWREGESLELEIEAGQYEKLLAHFERFIIMDDVELVALGYEPGAAETALGLTGPKAAEVMLRSGLPLLADPMTGTRVEWNGLDLRIYRGYGALAEHYEIWTPATGLMRLWRTLSTAGAMPVGSVALEAFRIAEGIPLYGVDIAERDLPQETSQMRALHFNKGCYLGQEIVERIHSRGSVHRHLRSLKLDGFVPPGGTELKLDGSVVGHITSAAMLSFKGGSSIVALGMVKEAAEVGEKPLTYSNGDVSGTAHILASPAKF